MMGNLIHRNTSHGEELSWLKQKKIVYNPYINIIEVEEYFDTGAGEWRRIGRKSVGGFLPYFLRKVGRKISKNPVSDVFCHYHLIQFTQRKKPTLTEIDRYRKVYIVRYLPVGNLTLGINR